MDLRELRELIEFMKAEEITELEVERADVKVRIKRGAHFGHQPPPAPSSAAPPAAPASAPAPQSRAPAHPQGFMTVTSPIVGVFYRAPSPDAESYVEVGQPVKKGQILCVIEAMKLMNEIEAEADGRVIEILIENAHPVEYGQPLFLIEPAAAAP